MRLTKLTVENFRSITSPLSLDFDESGLVSLEAVNKDSGGSSGAGKSTIALAVAYALGFADLSATSLANRDNPKGMQVVLELDHDGTPVVITRGKSQSIKVGDQVSTGAAAVTEGMRQVFGVGPDTLKTLTYRQQKEPGLFLSMDDSSKKEFLGEILGLGAYEKALEATATALRGAGNELTVATDLMTGIESAQSSMPTLTEPTPVDNRSFAERGVIVNREHSQHKDALTAATERLGALQSTLDESNSTDDQIVAWKGTIAGLRSELAKTVTYTPDRTKFDSLTTAYANAAQLFAQWEAHDRSENQKNTDRVRQMRLELAPLQQSKGIAVGLAKQVVQLKAERSKLEQSVCPTCDRQWDEAQATLAAIDSKIEDFEKQIKDHLEQYKRAAPLEQEIEVLSGKKITSQETTDAARAVQESKEALDQEKYRLQSEKQLFDQQQSANTSKSKAQIAQLELSIAQREQAIGQGFFSQIEEQRGLISDAKIKIGSLENALLMLKGEFENAKNSYKTQKDQYEKWVSAVGDLQSKFVAASNRVKAAAAAQKLEEDSMHTIRTFLTHILDEVLQEIASEANDILGKMPNVQHITVGFKTEAVTQKGTTKSKIVPVIVVDGQELVLASGILSGGQETSVELAVDLALAAVVERRTGAQPKWMFLDEAFDGLDGVTKEHCLEILKTYAADRLVIVISHVPEFQEVFDGKITLTLKDGVTTLSGE